MSLHYALHVLERYRAGGLSWPRRFLCRLHLMSCHRCQQKLRCLADNDIFLRHLLSAVEEKSLWENMETRQSRQGPCSKVGECQ